MPENKAQEFVDNFNVFLLIMCILGLCYVFFSVDPDKAAAIAKQERAEHALKEYYQKVGAFARVGE